MGHQESTIPTPYYVIDEAALVRNLQVLEAVQRRAGCHILLALKAFATFRTFPLLRASLSGTAASSLFEARLGYEEFGDSVHLCAPGFAEREFPELLSYCGHVTFNSLSQWQRFKPVVDANPRQTACAIRVNPEHSEVKVPIYDPCTQGSRLGVTAQHIEGVHLDGITGLHFHTLCGHDADALERTLAVVEEKFGTVLGRVNWLNLGGGHHITRAGYDLDLLCNLIGRLREQYGVEVYLEPGEAIVLNAGVLVGSVLDLLPNGAAVLDVSATAHMPDVLEMPYRPDIVGAGAPGEFEHTYRLGGPTCLAGDVIGDFSFAEPLQVGSQIVFEDMACYTMVKNTMFNGVRLPSIAVKDSTTGEVRLIRSFEYDDYRKRLS
jgi:carboxynorspermidine decarboxylase